MIRDLRFLLIFLLFMMISTPMVTLANNACEVTEKGMGLTINEAKEDAYRRALERCAGVEIQAVTKVKDFQTISSLVLTRVKGNIRLLEVLSKKCEGEGAYRTCEFAGKFLVEKGAILNNLKMWMKEAGEPTTGLIIKEKFSSTSPECAYDLEPIFLESEGLKKYLLGTGIRIPALEGLKEYNDVLEKSGVGEEDLVRVANAAKDLVSYIIYLRANYQARYVPDYDMCSVRMNASFDLIRTDTGKVATSLSLSEVAAGGSPEAAIKRILRKSVKKLADEMAQSIYYDMVVKVLQPKNIHVRFNLSSPGIADEIKNCLEENLVDAKKITVLNKMSDVIILGILTYSSPDKIWKEIEESSCSEKFDLNLKTITGDLVEIDASKLISTVESVYLKFDIKPYSLVTKLKKFLESIDGLKILGRTSFKPYTLKVSYDGDLDTLIGIITSCESLSIEIEDIAEDGSWVLFKVGKK